jgi:uncharacterized protein YdaL
VDDKTIPTDKVSTSKIIHALRILPHVRAKRESILQVSERGASDSKNSSLKARNRHMKALQIPPAPSNEKIPTSVNPPNEKITFLHTTLNPSAQTPSQIPKPKVTDNEKVPQVPSEP